MKKTGKILFGVLSTSALVGTGFAAWIVNNGFTDTKTVVVDSSVDTDVENKYSSVVDLTVVETDNSLKFASVANGEDLTLVYNLKANEAAYTTDFSLVTNEYIPDITVSLEVTSKAGLRADITTEVEKYLVLPETQTISYDTWLKEEYKTTILLETMSGKGSEVGASFEEIRRIIDKVELNHKLGVCLDTCHIYSAGYNIVEDLDGVLEQFDKIIGLDRLKAVHLNDSMMPFNSRKDRHEKIGKGTIGLDAIIKFINHPKLAHLPYYLETPNEIDGYAEEIKLLRENYSQ